MTHEQHFEFMKQTLKLAENGFIQISPSAFRGALLARDGQIVGEGYLANRDAKSPELHAIRAAGDSSQGATLYLNLEPWYDPQASVTQAIIEAQIGHVVIAMQDPNPTVSGKSIQELKNAGIEVTVGVLEKEARQLNEIYVKDTSTRRPFVHMLSAMSLDGKIATSLQDSNNITGTETSNFVHQLRARYDAVMVGVNTILHDNPQLTCKSLRGCDPWRIVIDSEAKTPLNSKVFLRSDPNDPRPPVLMVIGYGAHEERLRSMRHLGAEVIQCPSEDSSHVDLSKLMQLLNKRGITSVLLEGGGTLKSSALEAGIVDKVSFIVAPKIIGGKTALTPVEGDGVSFVSEAFPVHEMTPRFLGSDLLLEGYL